MDWCHSVGNQWCIAFKPCGYIVNDNSSLFMFINYLNWCYKWSRLLWYCWWWWWWWWWLGWCCYYCSGCFEAIWINYSGSMTFLSDITRLMLYYLNSICQLENVDRVQSWIDDWLFIVDKSVIKLSLARLFIIDCPQDTWPRLIEDISVWSCCWRRCSCSFCWGCCCFCYGRVLKDIICIGMHGSIWRRRRLWWWWWRREGHKNKTTREVVLMMIMVAARKFYNNSPIDRNVIFVVYLSCMYYYI